jgi:hypothetical protein
MAELGRADVTVGAELGPLRRGLAQSRQMIQKQVNWIERKQPFIDVEVRQKKFKAEMEKVKSEIREVNGKTARVDVDLKTKGFFAASRSVKMEMRSLRRAMAKDEGDRAFDKWITSLMSVRVQMGFVSLTVRQFIRVVGLLGPIITSLAAGLTALVGVLSTGLVGALAAVSSALAGAVLAFGGLYAAIKPYTAGIKNAAKASDAYADAVRKHGKSSDQATKKLKELNSVLAHVPAESPTVN